MSAAPSPPPELLEAWSERMLDTAPGERAALRDELAARHPEFRAALSRLFQRIGGVDRLLEVSYALPPAATDPLSIAGHRVLRRLGQGAFGTVFLCQQEHPVSRQVAIKVARGAVDPELLRRFHVERQLLASLSHPSIAQIYDAGQLPDGLPYFVMEFVDGSPFTDLCVKRRLDTGQRLRLFADLCRGIDHAHRRGVVHRDLKPGNVLLVELDGALQPKIIDFGIAKALTPPDDGEARTDTGRVMGTPGYMSPEQAGGRSDLVDARTDVFALGVMLYELLTGDLPWPRGALRETDTEPARPSVRITRDSRQDPGDGGGRRLAARVRGDLDWITLKAVRREREERYASASALADDIERHLAGRPVHAGPPSLAYRLRKLVRRQRPVVLTACVAVAVVAIGLGMARWRTRSADRLARTRQMQARSAVGRLLQRANDATMHRTPQNQALRRELAADALKFYDAWLADQPLDPGLRAGRCRALITLAEIHVVLGQVRQAILTADRARTDAAALLARTPDDVALRALSAGATRMRIKAMLFERRFAESLPYCESTVAELERCAAADLREHGMSLARSLRELALTKKMLGDPAAAVAAGRRSIAILEQLVASDANADAARQDLVWARFTLAEQLTSGRRFDAAERLLAAAAADLDRITVGREQISAAVYGQLGEVAWQRRDLAAAIRHLTRAQQACDAWLAREPNHLRAHGTLFECLRRLARACEFHGDLPRASAAMQRAIDVAAAKAAAFPEDPGRISDERGALYEFARAHWNRFRRRELALARPWLQRCVGLCAAAATAGGSQRPLFWESRSVQLLVDDADGRDTAAAWEELAAELPRQRELGPEELAQQVVEGWLGLTRSRLARGDRVGAAGALRSAGFYLGTVHGSTPRTRSEVAFWRARIAIASGDIDAARNSVIELTRHRKSWWGHWRAGDCELDVWQALARRSAPPSAILAARDRAAAHFRHVTESLGERVASAPNDPRVAVPFGLAAIGLAQCEIDRGERDHARARLTDALATLARVEAEAFRDLWDATRVRTGHELLRRLGAPPR